jgi:hypothetical protein
MRVHTAAPGETAELAVRNGNLRNHISLVSIISGRQGILHSLHICTLYSTTSTQKKKENVNRGK